MEGFNEAIDDYIVAELMKSPKIIDIYEKYIDKTVCPDFGDWVKLNYERLTRDQKRELDVDKVLEKILEKNGTD